MTTVRYWTRKFADDEVVILRDRWQGVGRDVLDEFDFSQDKFLEVDTAAARAAKKERIAAGEIIEGPEEWTWRQATQQSLVRQARRLPYELPAAYLAQRFVSDPLFGNSRDRGKWYNPISLVSDVATESVRNLGGLLLPFETGGALVRHGWRRAFG